MSLLEVTQWIFAAVLGIWFGLTLLNQIPTGLIAWLDAVRTADRLQLLPRWNFFAPTPGTQDFHVFARGFEPDGSQTDWKELDPYDERKWSTSFWNPHKKQRKVICDLIQYSMLTAVAIEGPERAILLSTPYLAILNSVTALYRKNNCVYCQFILASSQGFSEREGTILIRSEVHPCA